MESSVREQIIAAATQLIESSGDDPSAVTVRAIAEKAAVGVGLINYHFRTKDALIALCVQRIISKVIHSFSPDRSYPDDCSRLTAWAVQVFDFLFEHPAISRLSILSDLTSPAEGDNTFCTMRGFSFALQSNKIPDGRQKQLLFLLTTGMQSAFLRKEQSAAFIGCDLFDKSQRDCWIAQTVYLLFAGAKNDV